MKCFIILYPQLSESFSFPVYIYNNNSSSWKWQIFAQKQMWKVSNDETKHVNKKVHFICIEVLPKSLEYIKEIKTLQFAGHWDKLEKNIAHTDSPRQSLWNNFQESRKIG